MDTQTEKNLSHSCGLTVGRALQSVVLDLQFEGNTSARLDAEILMACCLNVDRSTVLAVSSRPLKKMEEEHVHFTL